MRGNRKLLLAVLSLALGAALAFTAGGLSDTYVSLALALNGVFAAGNGAEHFARRGGSSTTTTSKVTETP